MILQVTTSQTGGAGAAAMRLHCGLNAQEADSRLLSGTGKQCHSRKLELIPKRPMSSVQRLARKLGGGLTSQEKWEQTRKATGSPEIFSSGFDSDSALLTHPLLSQASVVNLHWVAGILPWAKFFGNVRKPVVWTLHDMNPFLGIFHYEVDRLRASPRAIAFDSEVRDKKREILAGVPDMVVVTPSRWLMELSQNSDVLGRFRHEHIPNGVDTSVFKPHSRQFARSVFGLPQNRRLLLITAERLSDYRKGFDLLTEALNIAQLSEEWDILEVGNGEVQVPIHQSHRIGQLSDERLMSLAYCAADITLVASREDNLPNVILESLCCGTPVIATPSGGNPEPIRQGLDGLVAKAVDALAISNALRRGAEMNFQTEAIAKSAASRYSLPVLARRYIELYSSLSNAVSPLPE